MFLEIKAGPGILPTTTRVQQITEILSTQPNSEHVRAEPAGSQGTTGAYRQIHAQMGIDRQPAQTAAQILNRTVITLCPHNQVGVARRLMKKKQFHHTPVLSDSGQVVGLLSDRDLLILPESEDNRLVGEIMTRDLIAATLDTEIREIAQMMVGHHIHCLPILSVDQTLEGIITTADVLKCIVNRAPLDLWV